MSESPDPVRRKPTLVSALLTHFASVILVCFLVFGLALYLVVIRPATTELADQAVRRAARELAVQLRHDVRQVEQSLMTLAQWGREGLIDRRDAAGFNRLMRPLLEHDPRLSAALFAAEDGSEMMLLQRPGNQWTNRITAAEDSDTEARHRWLVWHEADALPTVELRPSSYDPRRRPWFEGAVAQAAGSRPFWTGAYTFFTTREPGLTVSTAWRDANGQTQVVALDMLLADLSRITTAIAVGVRGGVVVFTPDGEILGLPRYPRFADPNEIRRSVFQSIDQLGVEFVAQGTAAWQAAGRPAASVGFEAESLQWRGHFLPIEVGGRTLWIAAFAPDADFVPARTRDLWILAGLLAGVIVLGALLALRFAARVRSPVAALVAQSERIGHLDLAPGPAIDTPWRELDTLVRQQSRTRELLKRATDALADARDQLEAKVTARTAELAEQQTALADQLLFVQILIDAVPNPMFYKGPDGRFLGCNTAYETTFGTTRTHLQGKTVLELDYLPADDRVAYHDEDMRVIAEASQVSREMAIPFADGRVHDTLYWVSGFRLSGGRPGGLLGVLVDITETKRAERRARDAETQLRATLESSPIAVVISRLDGTPVFANSRACELAGTDREHFLQQSAARRFADPRERDRALAILAAGGEVRDRQVALTHADGSTRWALLTMEQTRLGNEPVIIAWTYDVTPLKRIEHDLRKLSLAVEASPVMVVITSPGGQVQYVNPHFTKVTGYTLDDVSTELPEIFDAHGESEGVFDTLWSTLRQGRVWQAECQSRKRDGAHFWVSIAVSALREDDGTITHCVWVLEDVSTRKATETALRRAKQMAEEAAQTKSRFLANMSHEIRTPMNAIIGLSHLALETGLDDTQRDYLEKIRQAGQHLLRVINDILDFSRIEAGHVDIESVDFLLDEVLGQAATLVAQSAQAKQIELLLDIDPRIPGNLIGDPFRLGQVLTNLLGNAVKFTERGEVRLGVRQVGRSAGRVKLRFEVRDTGVGIAPEDQARLFEAFAQVDGSTSRRFGGSGLGLSIGRHLVDLMGGRMSLESQPGVGSTFAFTLPFEVQGEAAPPALPDRLHGLRVLVVDDHPAARDVLANLLTALPFRVETAPSGQAAVDAVAGADRDDPFGLVLMDWRMPGIDGLEATRRIKHDAGLAHPPVIILVSAFGGGDLSEEATDAGADAQVFKPLTSSTLVDAIMQAYGLRRAISALPAADGNTPADLTGLRVLVVEDNEINQQIARSLLESRGATVEVAGDGRAALAQLEAPDATLPDAVLMDLQMPVMDGYETTRVLRSQPRFARLPIIAMTAHAMAEERERCLAAGMNDHVAKPIEPERLFAALMRWRPARTPPSADPARWPSIDGLDVAAGLRRMGGDGALYHRLVAQFAATQRTVPARLRQQLADGAIEAVEHGAHALCGVAANIGASAVAAVAADLETALRQGRPGEDLLTRLDDTLTPLVEAIEALQAPAGTPTELGHGATDAVLDHLLELLRAADGEAGRYFAQWRAELLATLGESAVGDLAQALQIYDFDRAAGILSNIIDARRPPETPSP